MQYAGTHLHTPLFIMLGHEGCGAIEAAVAEKFQGVISIAESNCC